MLPSLLALFLLGGTASGQEGKLPVPSDLEQAAAEKSIRNVFQPEYEDRTLPGQQKLVLLLLDQGRETKDDPAARFVLFKEAATLASRSGNLDALLFTLTELVQLYQVDPPAFKEPFLTRAEAAATNAEDLKRLAGAFADLAYEALDADHAELAVKSAQASLAAAKRTKVVGLSVRCDAVVRAVIELRDGAEQARKAEGVLAAKPADPEANGAWGAYLCLSRGRWEQGLGFLSKGTDPVLRGLAEKELAAPADFVSQVEIADAWWDLGVSERNPVRKGRLWIHARTLYEAALANASGLTLIKLEQRIAEASLAGNPGGPSRVNRMGLVAWWRCDEGRGTFAANSADPENGATLVNGVEWVPGRLGRALQFDGRSGYLSCRADKLPATQEPQTISFWWKLPSLLARNEDLLCFSDAGMTGALQAGLSKTGLSFWKWGGGVFVTAPLPGTPGWHHCAFATDGKTHTLYLDGKREDRSSTPPQAVSVTHCEWGRYRGAGGADHYFSGALDELRIYNRPLTEAEIRGLATGTE